MFFFCLIRPRVQIVRIRATVSDGRAHIPRALRRDALGRADPLAQGGQIEPQLLSLIGRWGDRLQGLGDVGLVLARRLQLRLGLGDLSGQGFLLDCGIVKLRTQPHDAVAGEAQAGIAQIGLHRRGALGRLSLPAQRLELLANLVGEIAQPIEVGLHPLELALRLLAAPPVFEHARRLLDIGAALLGTGFQDLRQLALPDDDVHLAADAGIRQQLLDVHEPRFGAVDLVLAAAVAKHAAGHGHFRVFDGQRAIGIVDGQRHFRAPERLPIARAGEDDVLHLAAAEGFRAALTHDPGERVDHVRLAGTVWPHHGTDAGLELEGRRGRKGLEALESQRFKVHSLPI